VDPDETTVANKTGDGMLLELVLGKHSRGGPMPEARDDLALETAEEIAKANETGHTPVVFLHGHLWLLPSSWDLWATLFEEAGDAPLTPG